MTDKAKPFGGNNESPIKLQSAKIKQQVIITLEPEVNQVSVQTNIGDINLVMGMLIDALGQFIEIESARKRKGLF